MYNDPYQMPPPQEPQQPPSSPYPQAYDPYAPSPYGPPPGTQYGAPQVPPGQPPYGVPPMQFVPAPQKKSSLTWLWITLGIIGGLLVLGCAGCGIFFYNVGKQATNIVGPAFAVGEYYQFLKQGDYSKAYTFVDPNASYTVGGKAVTVSDEQSFAQAAQSVDATDGTITSIQTGQTTTDTTHMTMIITRNGSSYDVHLTLQQESGSWKIIAADGI